MLVGDLLINDRTMPRYSSIIYTECTQFLSASKGIPLYKSLPTSYSDFQKVKVRFKKTENVIGTAFNKAFLSETLKLSQKAVFSYSNPPTISENTDLFYIFPVDKYKFLYSKEITNSNSDYKRVMDIMLETFDNMEKATEIVTDLLKYTYSTTNLYEGLKSQAEIILYNIPYYYAVRVTPHLTYSDIISHY